MSNNQEPKVEESVLSSEDLSHESQKMICPSCKEPISTKVSYKTNSQTHLMAFVVALFAGACGCCFCLLPYCECCLYFFWMVIQWHLIVPGLGTWKDAKHKCPKCKKYIGTHEGENV